MMSDVTVNMNLKWFGKYSKTGHSLSLECEVEDVEKALDLETGEPTNEALIPLEEEQEQEDEK